MQPIGLAYLKRSILSRFPEDEVKIIDCQQAGRRTIALPKPFQYLQEFYFEHDKGPFSTFYHYYHFGMSFSEIVSEIENFEPDLIGISSLFSGYHNVVEDLALHLKDHLPKVPIVVGGSHPSACAHEVMQVTGFDYAICGEGELGIVEFIEYLKGSRAVSTVASLVYRDGDNVVLNERRNYEIDQIGIPDFSDLPLDHYLYKGRPIAFIVSSRSCPYGCKFCSIQDVFGKSYRRRPVDAILEELSERYREGYRVFDFEDDNLAFDRSSFLDLLTGIEEEFVQEDIELMAMNGLAYFNLDKQVLISMFRAGFRQLNVALVSANEEISQKVHRPLDLDKYLDVVSSAHNLGFMVTSYQILGLPLEPIASMIEGIKLQAGLPLLMGASIFYLPPNCDLVPNDERIEDHLFCRSTALHSYNSDISRDDLFTLFIVVRVINYIKSLDSDQIEIEGLLQKEKSTNFTHFNKKLALEIFYSMKSVMGLKGRTIGLAQ